jgi:sugar (pentulose or hexulose) kinase
LVYPFVAGNGNYRAGTHSYSVHNLALRHNSFDIIRASMEGVAFEIEKLVNLYTSCNIAADKIILSGGATRSKVWMKILATVLNRDLYISNQADRCCFGAYSIARKKDLGNYFVFPFEGEIVSPDKELLSFYQKKSKLYNKAFE